MMRRFKMNEIYGFYRDVYFYKDLKSQLWVIPDYNMTFKDCIKYNIDLLLDGFQVAA
jgi:hypothetical protein